MEGWRHGGMEGWKDERREGWRHGGREATSPEFAAAVFILSCSVLCFCQCAAAQLSRSRVLLGLLGPVEHTDPPWETTTSHSLQRKMALPVLGLFAQTLGRVAPPCCAQWKEPEPPRPVCSPVLWSMEMMIFTGSAGGLIDSSALLRIDV